MKEIIELHVCTVEKMVFQMQTSNDLNAILFSFGKQISLHTMDYASSDSKCLIFRAGNDQPNVLLQLNKEKKNASPVNDVCSSCNVSTRLQSTIQFDFLCELKRICCVYF